MRRLLPLLIASISLILAACSVLPSESFPREDNVDLDRFMGAWYVIAHIPPGPVANAYDSIERYEQVAPGKIHTTYTYRDGGFDQPLETMEPTGFVVDGTDNAVWGMQFYWPLKMQYVITDVGQSDASSAYETAIVAREKRDYVWILARTPKIDDATYQAMVERVKELGYDTSKLRKTPQQPLSERDDSQSNS